MEVGILDLSPRSVKGRVGKLPGQFQHFTSAETLWIRGSLSALIYEFPSKGLFTLSESAMSDLHLKVANVNEALCLRAFTD